MVKDFLLQNKDLFKNIALGLVFALVILGFCILLSNLLYQPKKMVKRGFEVEINQMTSKKIGNVVVGNLRAPKASSGQQKSIDIEKMVAKADIKKGAKVFKKCKTCHTIEKGGANRIGPNLFAIIGKKKASVIGFKYSAALQKKGGVWSVKEINQFILKPKDYLPGTKMAFAGLRKDKDRANVIAYLKSVGK